MTNQPPILTSNETSPGAAPNPLLSVWAWELRRVAARPLSWILALAAFLFFMGMVQFKHAWSLGTESGVPFLIYGTSAVGVLYEFVNVLMFVFALMLPFLVTEGVAADHRRRIHEVLMTTSLPSWAYIWGRFLAVLTEGLGLAGLLLSAYLLMGLLLHQRNAIYPLPAFTDVLSVWLVLVVPALIIIAGLGFTLGTLWPRHSRVMMLALLILWMLLFTVGGILGVNPTGNMMVIRLAPDLIQRVQAQLSAVPADQRTQIVLQAEAHLPDLSSVILPQYGLAAVGAALVAVAAGAFRRFRQVLG
jgi:ABC-type transport system involved in multi-copper enzyme maturation permease subunit